MEWIDKIGLGTVQFGLNYGISNASGKTTLAEVTKILAYASEIGLTYIDTAAAYGDAESVLGNTELNNFKVITKFMPPESGTPVSEFHKSLDKLKLNKIYGFLAHRPLYFLDNKAHWNALKELQAEGKIKKLGFSLNETSELKQLLEEGMEPDLVQVPYSFFDNRFKDQMIKLKENGCEIHVRSVFLQGLFFMDPEILSSHFDAVKPTLKELQGIHKTQLSGALLKFVLTLKHVDAVIMGVETTKQLQHNLESIAKADPISVKSPMISDTIAMPSKWPTNLTIK